MGIKKKFLFITTISILIILFLSYGIMYSYFYNSLFRETMENQRANVELNRRVADNFLESIYYTAVQLVSDRTLGEALSVNSSDPLERIHARTSIRDQFSHYTTYQIINDAYHYDTILFLSDLLPIASAFDTCTLNNIPSSAVDSVFSNTEIKTDDWFQKTAEQSVYVFINEQTDEICIARKITNNHHIGPYDPNGTAVIVVKIAMTQLEEIFFSVPVTANSGYAILNNDGDILFCSDVSLNENVFADAWAASRQGQVEEFVLHNGRESYQINCCNARYGIRFLFLTPVSDIRNAVQPLLLTYTLLFACIGLLLLLVIWIIIGRLIRPIIRFSSVAQSIHDTRTFDKKLLHVSDEKELQILENSFAILIDNVNSLIENIRIQDEKEKLSQLRALQAQINPHFIFNAMDMVNWLALSRGCNDIAEIVSSIANLMRYSITDADSMVPISLELDNIQEFISIYQLRHNNRLSLQTDLQSDAIQIPKFTLQPLVENAIRHASPPLGQELNICIRVWTHEKISVIEVHDNGIGCSSDELNRHLSYEETTLRLSSGFGIRNVNERIQLRFGKESGLSYQNEADGSLTAHITLYIHGNNNLS